MLICMKSAHCTKLDGHKGACGKTAVTAPDVRTAAQEQYRRENWPTSRDDYWSREQAFAAGAVWGAALVTPTREQIAQVLADLEPAYGGVDFYEGADAVLALLQKLRE